VITRPCPATAAALVCAAAVGGCGFGPGPSSEGTATLTVTRDYGSRTLVDEAEDDPPSSETVLRFLDREAEITTRYGGGFVQSIEGLSGTVDGGRSFDWFFYVNGIESPIGATDANVRGGDRIWWDYRDWTTATRVPAVVGSFPEPFAQQSVDGERTQVVVECAASGPACGEVTDQLDAAGVKASVQHHLTEAGAADEMRVLVGPWAQLRSDHAAAQLEDGPSASGVFAEPEKPGGGWTIAALTDDGAVASRLRHAGLVAAVRDGEDPATWLVTGTDPRVVRDAASLLDEEDLGDRYAVAVSGGRSLPLPVTSGSSDR
jgi:Domain of unknown function (DUF4430)